MDKQTIRKWAEKYGYVEEKAKDSTLLIFNKGKIQINVWFTTMTVSTSLKHPFKGKTQMFRKHVNNELMKKILKNPRIHTNRGYRKKQNDPTKYGGYQVMDSM